MLQISNLDMSIEITASRLQPRVSLKQLSNKINLHSFPGCNLVSSHSDTALVIHVYKTMGKKSVFKCIHSVGVILESRHYHLDRDSTPAE